MELQLYKLHFTTPVHFGDNREDYGISLQTLQSDTLYSALMSCLAKIGYAIPDDGDLGFATSSLFPFYQKCREANAVFFLPKPLKQSLPKLKDVKDAKKVKKVAWLDFDYFEKVAQGNSLFKNGVDIGNVKGPFLTTKTIESCFISAQVSPRVTVSRTGQEDAMPFYMDRVYFKDFSGLYFIAKYKGNGEMEVLEKALNVLKDEGLGTDRNVGNGFFEWTKETKDLILPESEYSMSLSAFIPESKNQLETMLGDKNVAYDFSRRGGWITTPPNNSLRKNYIYAFLPGSVFKKKSNEIEIDGSINELTPELPKTMNIDHRIWRSGKALFIPIRL